MSSLGNPAGSLSAPAGLGTLLLLKAQRRQALACAALCALWFGLAAGLRPLALPDEGRYVGVAWEMLRSGDWLVPTLNGAPFFHKPPLFYWLTAASMAVFGPDPWAARFGAVLATTSVATALFAFVRRHQGIRAAWTTVVVLATMPLFYGSSQYANLDPLVAACIGLTILCGAETGLRRERGEPFAAMRYGAFVFAALGVLAKGLIGLVLPALVLVFWALLTGRLARTLRLWLWVPGWVAFLAIAAPWFVAVQLRHPDFARYFFVVQHFDRFATGSFNNPQPLWFYPALLALGAAPWSPWLARLAIARRQAPPSPEGCSVTALMAVWAAVVIAFFSMPHSKPIGYILPALPPLAWAIARAVGGGPRPRLDWQRATAATAAAICVGTVVTLHFQQPKSQAALAAHLEARRQPGEPVVFIGHYYFDVPVCARLDAPVRVVDDWAPAEVAKDSWRRELVDAERFMPPGTASRRLSADAVAALGLPGPSAWVVGPATAPQRFPWLATATPVFEREGTVLWHLRADRGAPQALPPY